MTEARIKVVLIWVIGRLNEMERAGLIAGCSHGLTGAIEVFEELKRRSFIPDRQEILRAFGALDIPQELHDDFLALIAPSY